MSDDSIVAQSDNPDGGIVAQSGKSPLDIVAHQNQEVADYIEEPPVNIFPEGGNRLRETLERDSAEAAPLGSGARRDEGNEDLSVDARLAIMERRLNEMKKRPHVDDVPLLEKYEEQLEAIALEHDGHTGDPTGGRALRLIEEIGVIMEDHS